MKIISEYVAAWALPKEDVPLHLMLEPTISYDMIRVKLPEELVLSEFFNVKSYTQENSLFLNSKLKIRNFFGMTVASKTEFESPQMKKTINIELIANGQDIFSKDYEVNIFRPYVSSAESPRVIAFNPKDNGFKKRGF